ncbi:lateral signaling target protein 2-like protein [Pyrus ussuriensis x Pyrus communis]|uniref:Lateral signaling target protein 2-like protein n=1 Tax=Pyrus ussuriensis x Pyrus communis TaxID=2448454 RepID=A0A5N5GTB9_9ROSA|nr:lateral signaling target protein 2-like protein [Pyrus ussuriensis x Pyrus communis]
MENNQEPCSPNSLKQKLRSSLCIIPCFPTPKNYHHGALTAPPTPNGTDNVSLVRTSLFSPNSRSSRSSHRHHHHHHHNNSHYEFAELKDKCKNLIGRMHGRGNGHGHVGRRHHSSSADFKYDALSYALNFDHEETDLEDYPVRSFSSRLPHSPPQSSQESSSVASPSASKEITAYS